MDKESELVVAEVQCYSVDSRGYYSELQDFDFVAPLDLEAPLRESIAENADPSLGFGDPSFDFKCYTANFLGLHIDLQQKPLQVKYIVQSMREQRNAILYLCKEDLRSPERLINERNRSAVITQRPSGLAKDFLREVCGSVSEYESGYASDTNSVAGASSFAIDFTEHQGIAEEDGMEDIFMTKWKPKTQHKVTIIPSPTVPTQYQRRNNAHTTLNKTTSSITEISSTGNPAKHWSNGKAALFSTSLPSLDEPDQDWFRSRFPVMRSSEPMKQSKRKVQIVHHRQQCQTLNPRLQHKTLDLQHPRDSQQQKRLTFTNFETFWTFEGPKISSPIYRPPDPVPAPPESKLQRSYAIKRRSLLDLGISKQIYELSVNPTHIECHLKDSGHPSPDETLSLQMRVFNYMTVGQLKERICEEIQKKTSVSVLPSSLVLYYSHSGGDYELLVEQQLMFNTYFHKLTESAQAPESGPILRVRLTSRLPERELRVLYRISQLMGVLLDDSVTAQGVDTSNLTVLPSCDLEEVQVVRRSLHSYMQKVVRERNEQEYCSCRDIASREATMQLSLMTPTDNMIPVTFHYKTVFSLKRNLSIHTFADRALSGVFPCLVACGLVRNKIEDYALQVAGEESYIYGEIELIAFRHIRKCIVKSEPIHLSVTERPPIEVERPHQFSWMSVDPYSSTAMSHSELSDCIPICQEDVSSVWETRDKLKLIKLQFEGIPHIPGKGISVRLVLKLLHGSSELCSSVVSTSKVAARDLTWIEDMEFDIEIKDIPKAARIMVVLVESRSRQTSHGDYDKSQLLFWGLLSVFEPTGRLRSGDCGLRLWKGREIKGIDDNAVPPNFATHPANNPHLKAVRLTVTFQMVKLVPIFYPSTAEESRTVLTRQHPAIPNVKTRRQFRNMLEMIKTKKLYKALPHYIQMSNWSQLPGMLELFHALDELQEGIRDVPDHVAIRLLDSDFPDEHVRTFAVQALAQLPDEQLEDYLLQLVQALKFEANHDSDLARFLLKKALTNKTIGHFFFWYLRSEMYNRLHMARFAVILEAYLKGCGEALLTKFTDQVDIQNSLCNMAVKLRKECENGRDLEKMQGLLPSYLQELESPRFLFIPVHNPRNVLGKLKPQKCKVMSSKKRPMWLEMYNIHPSALRQSPIRLILKLGDDLRQDMITLRMFSLFEKLWEEQGLDLELIPYGCMATGPQTGFIEVVKNAKTIKEVSSVKSSTKLFEWIVSHQKNEFGETDYDKLDAAIKRFTRSCAGYSVATYVLGIGDRHNDNIMITTSGNLFHIDFGHFLGHIKHFMGFKREWAPFVLTPDFVYVMGGEKSEMFETYKNLCCRAFLTLRRHADLIINLFSLMRSTGIPELTCVEDTDYIRNVLEVDLTSEHVAEMRFRKVIQKCLNLKWTVQIMWRLHIAKHGSSD